jgi:hypothetical protein
MSFLLADDFTIALQPEDCDRLQVSNIYYVGQADQLAVAEIRRELAAFDTTQALSDWQSHSPSQTYLAGVRVLSNLGVTYYALQNVPAGIDLESTTYWKLGDNRPQELVHAAMRLATYHLASRFTNGSLPNSILQNIADVRKWLTDQATGKIIPVLPRQEGQQTNRYGSLPSQNDGGTIWM